MLKFGTINYIEELKFMEDNYSLYKENETVLEWRIIDYTVKMKLKTISNFTSLLF